MRSGFLLEKTPRLSEYLVIFLLYEYTGRCNNLELSFVLLIVFLESFISRFRFKGVLSSQE